MRIAIDGRTIVKNRTGVGVYAERLVRSLLKVDKANEYTLFLAEDDSALEAPNLRKIVLPSSTTFGPNRLWENVTLPRFLRRELIDIYFSPAYVLPLLQRSRSSAQRRRKPSMVVTVHDLVSYHYPETFTLKMRVWQRLFVTNAVRVADRILADSDSTAKDLRRFYDVPDGLIRVVHLPIDEHFGPVTDPATLHHIRTTYGLPPTYVLYVGTLEPRKNVTRLAAAYAKLRPSVRAGTKLVLVGGQGWHSEEIQHELASLGLGNEIQQLGYVPRSDLPGLYTLATVFAYLPFYEGFGAPPLEAMACGTPVLCSRASSLPEVVGDAGILADPLDVDEISTQLERLLTDKSLRATYSKYGIERTRLFRGEDKASDVLRIFEELCGEREGS